MKYYLAVDIGASSGRHILAHIADGKIVLEEIHRFANQMHRDEASGKLCWDAEYLFGEILAGMKKCKELGMIPESIGIDTWAVDFRLLDAEEKPLGPIVAYRDDRTQGMDDEVYKIIPLDELYGRNGIQKLMFNTVYQLMAVKQESPELLEKAENFLMVPDYFHYLLTGKMGVEYTNATTTQLVNAETKDWDYELIDRLGYPRKIFPEILKPGTTLGTLKQEIIDEIGYDCKVVLPATHDTGSAVLAVPSNEEKTMYISSGTWSLMGVERMEADCSAKSMAKNFTNEGGYNYRFRYLKNIMGLWMIQSVKKELAEDYSFGQLCDMAEDASIDSIVDCNSDVFLAPESMIEAVKAECARTGQAVPETAGELARVIYRSLAVCYKKTAEELEEMNDHHYGQLHIVGGGANAGYLNQLTANATGKTILAGPTEATAIGNLMVQMMAQGEFDTLENARKCVYESFEIKTFNPKGV